FLQNYFNGIALQTWSLAVEEHFYLGLPFLLILLAARRPGVADPFRALVPVFWMVAIAALTLRIRLAAQLPFSLRVHYTPTHLRVDPLFFGVLLAYFWHFRRPVIAPLLAGRTRQLAGIGLLLLLPPFFAMRERTPFLYTFGFTLCYLGSGALLLAAVGKDWPRNAVIHLLARIGESSYAIYLWHSLVLSWIIPSLAGLVGVKEFPFEVTLSLYLVLSIVVGLVMTRLIEVPILRLRDRLVPSRGRPLADRSGEEAQAGPQGDFAAPSVPLTPRDTIRIGRIGPPDRLPSDLRSRQLNINII
ncbi:MAG: acyltransferase, partial [Isosphaeraceae bacterium]|nr:acyltransferase [Isosphaeraceae bacterium]